MGNYLHTRLLCATSCIPANCGKLLTYPLTVSNQLKTRWLIAIGYMPTSCGQLFTFPLAGHLATHTHTSCEQLVTYTLAVGNYSCGQLSINPLSVRNLLHTNWLWTTGCPLAAGNYSYTR